MGLSKRPGKKTFSPACRWASWYPQLADCLLVAVTEKRTKEEIDWLATVCG